MPTFGWRHLTTTGEIIVHDLLFPVGLAFHRAVLWLTHEDESINWPVSFHPAKSWPRPYRRTRAVADASGIDAFFNEPGEVRQVKCQRVHLLDT